MRSNISRSGMTVTDRLATLLLVLVTTAGATFMVLIAPGSGSLEAQPIRVTYDVMAAVLLLPWLALAIVRPAWRPSSRLLPAIIVVLIAFAVSSVTSRVPRLSLEMLGYAVLLAELYLLLVTLMRQPAIRIHLERLALVLCLLASALYVLQVVVVWIEWWGLVGRVAIPPLRPGYLGLLFGSPNPVATLVLMLGAFGLATNQLAGRSGWVATGLILGLVAVATFLTGSRGAWLGAAASLVAVIGLAVLTQPGVRSRARGFVQSRVGAVAIVVATPMVLLAGVLAALSGRLSLDDGGYRAAFARASMQMFESSPLTGVGAGTWGVSRSAHSAVTDQDYYIPHAHNLYIQTFAEFGVVGVAAGLFALGALVVLIGRAIRSDHRSRRRVAFAALFALVLFAVQQVADVLVNVPALLLAIALPIAWLDAADRPHGSNPSTGSNARLTMGYVVLLGATLTTCAILVGLILIESAADLARHGVRAANSSDWSEATRLFREAAAIDPDVAIYRFELGVSAANSGDLRLAESSLSTSAEADDYPYAWLNLAAVRWQLGDTSGARDALVRAERLGLQRTPISMASGWLREQLGDEQAAIDEYATAVRQAPTLASDPFWLSERVRPGTFEAILESVDQGTDFETRLRIDLVLDRFDRAEAEASTLAASDPELYPYLVEAWQGDQVAWESIVAAASGRPLDSFRAGWCRLIAAHLGDDASAEKFGRWLFTIGSPDSAPAILGRIVTEKAVPLPPNLLDRYGSIFRREALNSQVVSVLPQIAWGTTVPAP